jgi:acetyl esterase/lipase
MREGGVGFRQFVRGWCLLALLGGGLVCGPASAADFYDVSEAELAGEPGTIIRTAPLEVYPPGVRGYRVLYRSTGLNGEPIAVSGVIAIPGKKAANRPIVAWAHPTTGVARKCAPSLHHAPLDTIPGLTEMMANGYVVTATDYPGLGTAGPHPYLVGVSEGRAVLDSVRAVRTFEEASAGQHFAVWGHSQGGHAALFAGELAASYAKELKLVGVAAAAPASELGQLFEDDLKTTAGHGLTALTLTAWSKLYDMALEAVIEAGAIGNVEKIGAECLAGFSDTIIDIKAVEQLKGKFLRADPVTTSPWSKVVAINTPGQMKAGGPVFIAQGSGDKVVDPPVTTAFATKLCNQGAHVRFFEVPDASHEVIAKVSAAAAVSWMADRFAGSPPPTSCVKK